MVNLSNITGESVDLNNLQELDLFSQNEYLRPVKDYFDESNLDCKYISEESFCRKFRNESEFLCISMNLQSLSAKFTSLTNFLDVLKKNDIFPDILCIQEVWYFNPNLHQINGYNCLYELRDGNRGGGVLIYYKNIYTATLLNDVSIFKQSIIESIAVKIDIKGGKSLTFLNLYRPNTHLSLSRSEQLDSFLTAFTEQLEKLDNLKVPVFILGDFNIDLMKIKHESTFLAQNATDFSDIISSYGLHQIISKCTRIYGQSKTLIDHIMTSDINMIKSCGVLTETFSDHFFTYITISNIRKKYSSNNVRFTRKFSIDNMNRFREMLSNLSWQSTLSSNCPNEACNHFLTDFLDIFHLNFPLLKIKDNKNRQPVNGFMSKGLLISRRHKLKLAKKVKLNPTVENKDHYQKYRNIYNSALRKAKKIYYDKKIKNSNGESKIVWQVINEACNKTKKNNDIDSLMINDRIITSKQEIANNFNSHFASVGHKTSVNVPRTNHDFTDYLPPRQQRSFFLQPVVPFELAEIILSMNKKKSRDVNDISFDIIHHCVFQIIKPLSHIYNLSVTTGIFPDSLKTSKVIPIFKNSGSKLEMNNYRGVSIGNVFSKIFEKIVTMRLTTFLGDNGFFDKHQYGFLKGRSTSQALLQITNFITNALNNSEITLAIFLDVMKCFDCVPHDILLYKLSNAGIRGLALDWFKSFLQDRKQKAKIDNTWSNNTCNLDISVMQGSVLGVLLFIIFINDISNCSEILFNVLFADDISSLLSDKNLDSLICRANTELNKLSNWYSANKLRIHPEKSRCMIFTSKYKDIELPLYNDSHYLPLFINLNDYTESDISKIKLVKLIPNSDEKAIKILGVYIDNKLSMSHHIKNIQGKISQGLYCLNQAKNFLNKDCLKLIYFSQVHSHLLYCNHLLSMATETSLKPLVIAQKKAVRLVYAAKSRDHTKDFFQDLNTLPIDKLIKESAYEFIYNYVHLNLPEGFQDMWVSNEMMREHDYDLRNDNDFYLQRVRYAYLEDHPKFYFPRLWNNLEEQYKTLLTKSEFKKNIRRKLLTEII